MLVSGVTAQADLAGAVHLLVDTRLGSASLRATRPPRQATYPGDVSSHEAGSDTPTADFLAGGRRSHSVQLGGGGV